MNEDRATKYHRLKRTASIVSLGWTVLLMTMLLVTGTSTGMRELAERWAAGLPLPLQPVATVGFFVVLLMVASEAAGLPFAFYTEFFLERRFGMLSQSLASWLVDQLKGFAVAATLGIPLATVIYFFIRRSPDGWWLPAGSIFAALIVGLANLGPVLVLPLFYSVKPLARESLRLRLLALAERAGARVLGAYEWGLGAKTKKANAALTGVAGTRRILVSDTMLNDYSDDEIEVVLAHELAHHVHGDIWKGLVFESGLIVAGFWVAARVLSTLSPRLGLGGPADLAGLPLLLLAAGAVSLVMLPVSHALSRAHERSADRFALELTHNPSAFISAMRRLGAQNLAEERPSKIVQLLFYSHPPIRERIAAAERFTVPVGDGL